MAQAKLFVDILGNHYPERLGSVSPGSGYSLDGELIDVGFETGRDIELALDGKTFSGSRLQVCRPRDEGQGEPRSLSLESDYADVLIRFGSMPLMQVSWESSFVKDGLIPKATALKDHGGDVPVSARKKALDPESVRC